METLTTQTKPTRPSELTSEIKSLGLDPDALHLHFARFAASSVRGHGAQHFPIADTCRIDNGGIIPAHAFVKPDDQDLLATPRGFVAFIPAAGAATRYASPLAALTRALKSDSIEAFHDVAQDLVARGALHWPLIPALTELLNHPESYARITNKQRALLQRNLRQPKALMPCVRDGLSYLGMKLHEHAALGGLEGEAFVAPGFFGEEFRSEIARLLPTVAAPGVGTEVPTPLVFEQGPDLSTLRCNPDGSPYRETNGKLSIVPAGHGALVRLFPRVQEHFPHAHSLLIRNIDNISGSLPQAIQATRVLMVSHVRILEVLRRIRHALAARNLEDAAKAAIILHHALPNPILTPEASAALTEVKSETERVLWQLQFELFHADPLHDLSVAALTQLYARPLNTLGQVPNRGTDVGGTPVFLKQTRETQKAPNQMLGSTTKICLELPHASQEQRAILADASRATHFNPVFVAAEIPGDDTPYQKSDHPFWLIAKKMYRGEEVYYHESLLYELLGNSSMANAVFIEIPRLLFNPHKTLDDAAGRTAADWLPTGV